MPMEERSGIKVLTMSGADGRMSWRISGKLAHRPKGRYGENLFEVRGARATRAEVIAAWAGEAKNYDATKNVCRADAVCGHTRNWFGATKVGAASLDGAHEKCGFATMTHRDPGPASGRIKVARRTTGTLTPRCFLGPRESD